MGQNNSVDIMISDRAIGGLLIFISVVVVILYLMCLFYWPWASFVITIPYVGSFHIRELAIAVPVIIIVIAFFAIVGWVGVTMATTPTPEEAERMLREALKEEEERMKAEAEKAEEEKKEEKKEE